jgi:hypothetical protein
MFMYVNALANGIMLHLPLRHDFITIFKIKHKIYIASGSSLTQLKILGERLI